VHHILALAWPSASAAPVAAEHVEQVCHSTAASGAARNTLVDGILTQLSTEQRNGTGQSQKYVNALNATPLTLYHPSFVLSHSSTSCMHHHLHHLQRTTHVPKAEPGTNPGCIRMHPMH